MDDETKEVRREEIAVAALRVFRRRGFALSRVEDICKEAGIAKGTYYLYYSTREEVLGVLLQHFLSEGRAGLEALASGPISDAAAAVGEIIDDAAQRLDFIPLFWEVAGHQAVQSEYELNRKLSELFDGLAEGFEDVLRAGRQAGSLRGDLDIPAFSRMIVSAIDGVILHAALFGDQMQVHLQEQKIELMNMIRAYTVSN